MKFKVKYLHARFSCVVNRWNVKLTFDNLERIEFDVKYMQVGAQTIKRLAAGIQEIKAEDVHFSFIDSCIKLKKWKTLKKAGVELWNPDKPKNLAKTVTVK